MRIYIFCGASALNMSFDSFHLLDADIWKEVEDRHIQSNGYVYAGRKYKDEEYEAKVFIKKREKT
jgi:hypothetical protein